MTEPGLQKLGEDIITTAARIVRWVPKNSDISLSLAAARILARLNDSGPTRISDLAAVERSSQPTITNHVKRLEALGLVERRSHPGDARAWIISLTTEGERDGVGCRAGARRFSGFESDRERQAARISGQRGFFASAASRD